MSNSRSVRPSNVSSNESKKSLACFWTTEQIRAVTKNSFSFSKFSARGPIVDFFRCKTKILDQENLWRAQKWLQTGKYYLELVLRYFWERTSTTDFHFLRFQCLDFQSKFVDFVIRQKQKQLVALNWFHHPRARANRFRSVRCIG